MSPAPRPPDLPVERVRSRVGAYVYGNILVLAAIVSALALSCTPAAQAAPQEALTPVVANVITPPQPVLTSDGRRQMAYELQAQSSTFDILGLDVIWTGEFAVNGWIEKIEDVRG